MRPGMKKKRVRMRLIITSMSHAFFFKKTASGGMKIARMIKKELLIICHYFAVEFFQEELKK